MPNDEAFIDNYTPFALQAAGAAAGTFIGGRIGRGPEGGRIGSGVGTAVGELIGDAPVQTYRSLKTATKKTIQESQELLERIKRFDPDRYVLEQFGATKFYSIYR